MVGAVPEDQQTRPPVASRSSGAATPTVRRRPRLEPRVLPVKHWVQAVDPADPYVLRFWSALIGPGAVADFLRLNAAAKTRRSLLEPTHIHVLVREGLSGHHRGHWWVLERAPLLGRHHEHRLSPPMRAEHRAWRQRIGP